MEVDIPLTIGDIPFHDGENGTAPGPTCYPQANPAPGGFAAPDAGMGFPSTAGMPNPAVGFNPAAPAPYPAGGMNPSPYPGGVNPSPYPSAPGANPQGPYPPAPGYNPQAPYPSALNGNGQGPYPPAQAPYAPPPAQYPSAPYPAGDAGAAQPYQNGPAGYNPAATGYAPQLVDPAGGNSVMYPQVGDAQAFYDPNTSADTPLLPSARK